MVSGFRSISLNQTIHCGPKNLLVKHTTISNIVFMSDIIKYCNKISRLTDIAADDLLQKITKKHFKKGEVINREGQVCRYLFYIEKGLVKHYFYHKDKVFILRFFSEGNMFTVLESFFNHTPSNLITVALEDTITYRLHIHDLEELCKRHHSFETFFRTFLSAGAVSMVQRTKEMLETNTTELYNNFVKKNGTLMQRISLGDVASYLGVSQVSISRIRSKK